MTLIRDRILQAIYGSALIATAVSSTACGTDELPSEPANNTLTSTPGTTTSTLTQRTSQTGSVSDTTQTADTSAAQTSASTTTLETSSSTSTQTNTSQTSSSTTTSTSKMEECDESAAESPNPDSHTYGQKLTLKICIDNPGLGPCKAGPEISQDERKQLVRDSGTIESSFCMTGFSYDPDGFQKGGSSFCGPVSANRLKCCYVVDAKISGTVCQGRPFTVEGIARTAEVAQNEGWLHEIQIEGVESLQRQLRQEIAEHWAEDGLHEHASIASFSRFLMELLSLGAPRSLVAATTKAIDDEIRHAADCFGVAVYAGYPVGPNEVDTHGSMSGAGEIKAILKGAILEGCIGETLAASNALWQVTQTSHPEVREVLQRISRDEADHAILAWEFVGWVLTKHPELRGFAKQTFDTALAPPALGWATGTTEKERLMLQHGALSEPLRQRLSRHALHEVIAPCVQALFSLDDVDEAVSV